jgi:hypothetical protein
MAKMVALNFANGIVSSINTDDDLATNGEHVFARWSATVHSSTRSRERSSSPVVGESRRMFGNRHAIDCSVF